MKIPIEISIGVPGYGKYVVDGLNGVNKTFLGGNQHGYQNITITCQGLGMIEYVPSRYSVFILIPIQIWCNVALIYGR